MHHPFCDADTCDAAAQHMIVLVAE